jgi:hypothetical protein
MSTATKGQRSSQFRVKIKISVTYTNKRFIFKTHHYEQSISVAITTGHRFTMGPAPGIHKYLISTGELINVDPSRIIVYLAEFKSHTLASSSMTYYSRVSATQKNDRRRKGLSLHVDHRVSKRMAAG